jgi:hypothetical protein
VGESGFPFSPFSFLLPFLEFSLIFYFFANNTSIGLTLASGEQNLTLFNL